MKKQAIKINPDTKGRVARYVLREFKALARQKPIPGVEVDTKPYLNGREEGISILLWGEKIHSIAFAEHRSSDAIVVYVNEGRTYIPDYGITDKAYKEAKYFDPGQYAKAAKYIYDVIKKNAVSKKAAIVDAVLKESKSPPGWKKTVERMKKHKEIDNPFALAWSMYNKGYKPHRKSK